MAFENLKKAGITLLLSKLKTRLESMFVKIEDAVLSVNGEEPDEYGEVTLNRVNLAGDLESSFSQTSTQEFIQRTSGGSASIEDGDAWLSILQGRREHDGYVAEARDFQVHPVNEEEPISAVIDWDDFLEQVTETSTTTFSYTTEWNLDPATYGITVTGTPTNGDSIVVDYVKEERGTITQANPTAFVSTGWNLYMASSDYQGYTGLARVVRYSDDYGYMIKGTRTALQFSATLAGEKSNLVEADGLFQVPSDGFVWVVGGSSADTAIFPTHSDWSNGYPGDFQAYSRSAINLSTLMGEYFPHGLCQVENTRDEINLSLGTVTARIDRMEYDAENLEAARSSGRAFEYDTDWIYIVKESISTISIPSEYQVSGQYAANDHGLEFFEGTAVPVLAQTIYGANLKNKLERDVLTKSQQTLSSAEKTQARNNIDAAAKSDVSAVNTKLTNLFKYVMYQYALPDIPANTTLQITAANLKITTPAGYKPFAIHRFSSGSVNLAITQVNCGVTGSSNCIGIRNITGSTQSGKTASIGIMYIKTGFGF